MAEQQGRRHFMLVVSGRDAHDLFPLLPHDLLCKMVCTRLDLQVTVCLPFAWNENDIWNRVKDGVGKTKYVNDIEKTWTVYVGSRRSRLFWRIYTKRYEKVYLRYEVELKRHHAHTVFQTLDRYGADALVPVYLERLKKLKVTDVAKEPALELVLNLKNSDMDIDLIEEERLATIAGMRTWLDNMSIAFERRLSDHDLGHIMAEYIGQWTRMSTAMFDELDHDAPFLPGRWY